MLINLGKCILEIDLMMKPKVKPIHRIIALPFQIIGFTFVVVFFIVALISAPHRAKKLVKGMIEEIKK
jgi:hypothetical protein